MKKNLGVSMISLVITIIVIIILAAVAFGSSTDTIENANFSNFVNNIAEVQNLLDQKVVALKGTEGKNGVQRTDAQVYNYIAKGATTLNDTEGKYWLPRGYAAKLECTRIEPDTSKEAIGYELPKIRVSTLYTNGIDCSYFVTNTGTVFVWPPYIYKDELWVNGDTKLVDENGNSYKPQSGEVYPKYEINSKCFIFNIDGLEIIVDALPRFQAGEWPETLYERLASGNCYSIYYGDNKYNNGKWDYINKNNLPKGAESDELYDITKDKVGNPN